jgi:hypothetical protein
MVYHTSMITRAMRLPGASVRDGSSFSGMSTTHVSESCGLRKGCCLRLAWNGPGIARFSTVGQLSKSPQRTERPAFRIPPKSVPFGSHETQKL